MSATLAGALKAYIESLGLGIPVFRDIAPEAQAYPFVTVQDAISDVPQRTGDGTYKRTIEQVQIDIWEQIGTTSGRAESYTLAKAILRALRDARLPTAPEQVYRVELFGRVRFRDPTTNTVRNSITLNVRRAL